MNQELVDRVVSSLKELIVSEVGSMEPGSYSRVIKLAAYAERVSKMNVKRVGDAMRGMRRPGAYGMGGLLPGYGGNGDGVEDVLRDDAMEANMLDGGYGQVVGAGGPLPMLGFGGLGGPQDQHDLLRELIMSVRKKDDQPRAPGRLAEDLQSVLDLIERLEKLPEGATSRAALAPAHENVRKIAADLERAARMPTDPDPIQPRIPADPAMLMAYEHNALDPAAGPLARPELLRRHPPHLDVPEDVPPGRGEADRARDGGAAIARVEGAEQGLDRAVGLLLGG